VSSITVEHNELKKLCSNKLQEASVPSDQANIISDVLVHADLRGVNSHGVLRTEHYIKRVQSGGLNVNPNLSMQQTGIATKVLDGDDGFGHVIANRAMEEAIKLANEIGVGIVSTINSSHCGALSYFVNEAAQNNLIGIAMTHTDKFVVPFGGSEPFFGTNPIAFGLPAQKYKPVILDMATSNAALGKILHARKTGEEIPDDWAVDSEGNPITDPNNFASLLPFGGPKGYGLAMVVDVLCGVLTGMNYGPHINPMYDKYNEKRKLGHLFCVINPKYFTNLSTYLENMDKLIEEIHNVQPAKGFNRVLVPGEPEQINEEQSIKNGVAVEKSVFNFLNGEL